MALADRCRGDCKSTDIENILKSTNLYVIGTLSFRLAHVSKESTGTLDGFSSLNSISRLQKNSLSRGWESTDVCC